MGVESPDRHSMRHCESFSRVGRSGRIQGEIVRQPERYPRWILFIKVHFRRIVEHTIVISIEAPQTRKRSPFRCGDSARRAALCDRGGARRGEPINQRAAGLHERRSRARILAPLLFSFRVSKTAETKIARDEAPRTAAREPCAVYAGWTRFSSAYSFNGDNSLSTSRLLLPFSNEISFVARAYLRELFILKIERL